MESNRVWPKWISPGNETLNSESPPALKVTRRSENWTFRHLWRQTPGSLDHCRMSARKHNSTFRVVSYWSCNWIAGKHSQWERKCKVTVLTITPEVDIGLFQQGGLCYPKTTVWFCVRGYLCYPSFGCRHCYMVLLISLRASISKPTGNFVFKGSIIRNELSQPVACRQKKMNCLTIVRGFLTKLVN